MSIRKKKLQWEYLPVSGESTTTLWEDPAAVGDSKNILSHKRRRRPTTSTADGEADTTASPASTVDEETDVTVVAVASPDDGEADVAVASAASLVDEEADVTVVAGASSVDGEADATAFTQY